MSDDITVETDEEDSPEVEESDDFEKAMAWYGYEDAPLLKQVGRIAALARFGIEQFEFVAGIQEHGVEDDSTAFDLKVGMKDVQVLSMALNLVGFFAPPLSEHAQDLMERIVAGNDAVVLTSEQEAQIDAATEKFREASWAEMLGLSVEEYRQKKQAAAEEAEKTLIDTALDQGDGGIVLN